jgi:hypothetical protein
VAGTITGSALLIGAGGCSSSSSSDPPSKKTIDPRNFTARVDNPYFPLEPGTTWRYRGVKDGKRLLNVVTVTQRVKKIIGVPTVVLRDRAFLAGKLAEDTTDWYTQDRNGTVWYFGEATKELDRKGNVTSTEGSWQAGMNRARPGIFMPAHPRVGDSFSQEHLKGHAEDHFRVMSLSAPVRVPFGNFTNAIRTKEWTPLEPGVIDAKFYVRGIGEVKEAAVKGPRELGVLVSMKKAR